MIDKEKVIKGLECCMSESRCYKCPYLTEGECENGTSYYSKSSEDAITLLREQEPVTWSYEYNCFICSNCGLAIEDEVNCLMNNSINFCPTCGRKVKWNEAD